MCNTYFVCFRGREYLDFFYICSIYRSMEVFTNFFSFCPTSPPSPRQIQPLHCKLGSFYSYSAGTPLTFLPVRSVDRDVYVSGTPPFPEQHKFLDSSPVTPTSFFLSVTDSPSKSSCLGSPSILVRHNGSSFDFGSLPVTEQVPVSRLGLRS